MSRQIAAARLLVTRALLWTLVVFVFLVLAGVPRVVWAADAPPPAVTLTPADAPSSEEDPHAHAVKSDVYAEDTIVRVGALSVVAASAAMLATVGLRYRRELRR